MGFKYKNNPLIFLELDCVSEGQLYLKSFVVLDLSLFFFLKRNRFY